MINVFYFKVIFSLPYVVLYPSPPFEVYLNFHTKATIHSIQKFYYTIFVHRIQEKKGTRQILGGGDADGDELRFVRISEGFGRIRSRLHGWRMLGQRSRFFEQSGNWCLVVGQSST